MPSTFTWSKSERRYYRNTKPLPDSELSKWVKETVDASKLRVRAITEAYVSGSLNHAEWDLAMRSEIKAGSRAMAELASGGRLTSRQLGALGSAVKEQNKYLIGFASDLENGTISLGPGTVARAEMYAEGLWSRYQNFVRLREKGAGMTRERLILGSAEHCPDCPADAARGWVEIGTLANIGNRQCLSRCRCHFEYREGR